jgi:hypothetical protein
MSKSTKALGLAKPGPLISQFPTFRPFAHAGAELESTKLKTSSQVKSLEIRRFDKWLVSFLCWRDLINCPHYIHCPAPFSVFSGKNRLIIGSFRQNLQNRLLLFRFE